MPYISKEQIAAKREQLKKALPGFKLSVTRENYTGIRVALIAGPVDFGTINTGVNTYHFHNHYTGRALEVLNEIKNIINAGNGTESEDGDYGTIPNFYIWMSIGNWNKDYVQK